MNWLTSVLWRVQKKMAAALIIVMVGVVFAYHLGSGVVVDEATGLPMGGVYEIGRAHV